MDKGALTAQEQKIEDWFEAPMLVVTLILAVTLAVPLLFDLSDVWRRIFASLNLFIWFTFYIELFVKLYVSDSKMRAMKRNWVLIVIALAPLFISLRLMRFSRLFGLVRFLRLQKNIERLQKRVREIIYNVEQIFLALLIFVFTTGCIMWQVEGHFDGSISSFADALWWAVITVTTIGYGDVIPASPEGKILGAIVSLLGTLLFMVFVARVTTLFVQNKEIESLRKKVHRYERQSK